MTDHEITVKVQEWIDSSMTLSLNKTGICSSENKKVNSALRMMCAYRQYMFLQNSERTADFECSLRDYLLSFTTDISILGYTPSEPNKFGLALNHSTGRIYVKDDLPDYVNKKFIHKAFKGVTEIPQENAKSIKIVNSYIYELTNHKFSNFKSVEQQLAVIGALKVPDGYTALVAMSTGGGKSLITQAVSYQCDNSLTLIIVPTISLMLNQQKNAYDVIAPQNKDEIACYYSGCDVDSLINALDKSSVKMLFISPEAIIKNKKLQMSILESNKRGYLKNLIVDEAHIIIEWGSSFRVDFQCLDSFRNLLMKDNPTLRTFLLSATYTKRTVDNLKMFYSEDDRWIEIRLDALRKEPRFDIIECHSYTDKHNKLKELVCKLPHPMIVYVNTPDDAEKIRNELSEIPLKNIRVFTGKTSSAERDKIINEWIEDKFDLMIATCAFGVGVDKPDVRTILHTYVPSSPNQYYQECGRGGRDGQPCLSVMLFTEDDISTAVSMAQKVLTVEKLSGRWFSMLNSNKTNRKIDKIIIDTSVKPDYNNDSFYVEASNADIDWNVYVILLLRRAGLLNIVGVDYTDSKYIFTVIVRDSRILFKDDTAMDIFNIIREEESKSIYSQIAELAGKLRKVGKSCWSTMFNDAYMLTDEYCAGCNHHDKVRTEKSNSFPLKKPIIYPASEIKGKIKNVMSDSKEMLIISNNEPDSLLNLLLRAGADVIIMSAETDCSVSVWNTGIDNSVQMTMDYNEFFELSRINCNYFLSGCIVFYIGDDKALAAKLLSTTANKEYSRVYIVKNDFYVPQRNKHISELVNGACKYDYIIEKELK